MSSSECEGEVELLLNLAQVQSCTISARLLRFASKSISDGKLELSEFAISHTDSSSGSSNKIVQIYHKETRRAGRHSPLAWRESLGERELAAKQFRAPQLASRRAFRDAAARCAIDLCTRLSPAYSTYSPSSKFK